MHGLLFSAGQFHIIAHPFHKGRAAAIMKPGRICLLTLLATTVLMSSSVHAQFDEITNDQTDDSAAAADLQATEAPTLVADTAEPEVVVVVGTATPTATATLNPTPVVVTTRSGPKTADQLELELRAAGYPGPCDVDSMLAAFNRAYVAPTPPPHYPPSAPHKLSARRQSW